MRERRIILRRERVDKLNLLDAQSRCFRADSDNWIKFVTCAEESVPL